jgi:hypothetical protein
MADTSGVTAGTVVWYGAVRFGWVRWAIGMVGWGAVWLGPVGCGKDKGAPQLPFSFIRRNRSE